MKLKLFKKKAKHVVRGGNFPELFKTYKLGEKTLKNKFVMAPMTRSRAGQPGDFPTSKMVEYYKQRASAGLIISEGSQVSKQGQGYIWTPGCYTEEQFRGWKKVTDAVHSGGGLIAIQLWHCGGVSHKKINGLGPIGPGDVKSTKMKTVIAGEGNNVTPIDPTKPKAMTQKVIDETINDFVEAAKKSIKAGFDFVEIHGANGYLIDDFLRSEVNKRKDAYGGSPEKRAKFVVDLVEAVVKAVGKDKVGLRLSPFVRTSNEEEEKKIIPSFKIVLKKMNSIGISFIHLSEAGGPKLPIFPKDYRKIVRENFKGTIIATGLMTPERGEKLIKDNFIDLVGIGRSFISNPDYPRRVWLGAEMNEPVRESFFGGGDKGYIDYPFLETSNTKKR